MLIKTTINKFKLSNTWKFSNTYNYLNSNYFDSDNLQRILSRNNFFQFDYFQVRNKTKDFSNLFKSKILWILLSFGLVLYIFIISLFVGCILYLKYYHKFRLSSQIQPHLVHPLTPNPNLNQCYNLSHSNYQPPIEIMHLNNHESEFKQINKIKNPSLSCVSSNLIINNPLHYPNFNENSFKLGNIGKNHSNCLFCASEYCLECSTKPNQNKSNLSTIKFDYQNRFYHETYPSSINKFEYYSQTLCKLEFLFN